MVKNKIDFAFELLADIVCEINHGSNNAKFSKALKSWRWASSDLKNMAGIPERELFKDYNENDEYDVEDKMIYDEVSDWYETFNY